jgi:serine 3-dehydrogenase
MAETEFTIVRTGGDKAASDALYGRREPDDGRRHRRDALLVATLPPHLNINTLELMPVSQRLRRFRGCARSRFCLARPSNENGLVRQT